MTTSEQTYIFYSILDTLSELKREYDFLLSTFLQFSLYLRKEKESFRKQQWSNLLKFYMNIFNTLSLESDYMYTGIIKIKYQLAEANRNNHVLYDENSPSKTKTKCCCCWLEIEEKALGRKKRVSESEKFENASNRIQLIGVDLCSSRLRLVDDSNLMKNIGIQTQLFGNDRTSLKLIEAIDCSSPKIESIRITYESISTFANSYSFRHEVRRQIFLRMESNAVTTSIGSAFLGREQLAMASNNNTLDEGTHGTVEDQLDTGDCSDVPKTSFLVSTTNDLHLNFVDSALVTVENQFVTGNGTDALETTLLETPNNDLQSYSVEDQLVFSGLLFQFSEYTEENIRSFVRKERRKNTLSVSIVMASIKMNMAFNKVMSIMELRANQSLDKLKAIVLTKHERRTLKIDSQTECFEFFSSMVTFCKVLATMNTNELLPYFDDSEEEVKAALEYADLSSYISREDELLVSLSNSSLFSNRNALFTAISANPTSFLDEVSTFHFLSGTECPKMIYERSSFKITEAAINFHSSDNPLRHRDHQPCLAETFDKQLTLTNEKKEKKDSKSPKNKYSGGVKLDKTGAAKGSKKRKKSNTPSAQLNKVVKSFKKQKKDIFRRKIESNSDSDDDEDDEDSKFDENKDCGSENEEENSIAQLPKLTEQLLIGYQMLPNMSPTKILESYLFSAVKIFGRVKIKDVLKSMDEVGGFDDTDDDIFEEQHDLTDNGNMDPKEEYKSEDFAAVKSVDSLFAGAASSTNNREEMSAAHDRGTEKEDKKATVSNLSIAMEVEQQVPIQFIDSSVVNNMEPTKELLSAAHDQRTVANLSTEMEDKATVSNLSIAMEVEEMSSESVDSIAGASCTNSIMEPKVELLAAAHDHRTVSNLRNEMEDKATVSNLLSIAMEVEQMMPSQSVDCFAGGSSTNSIMEPKEELLAAAHDHRTVANLRNEMKEGSVFNIPETQYVGNFNVDAFEGYSEEDKPIFTKDGKNRIKGPIDVTGVQEQKQEEISFVDFNIALDGPLGFDSGIRLFFNKIVPNSMNGQPFFKVFKVPTELYANQIDMASKLQISKTKESERKLTSAIICFLNMFLYAIRELLLFQPFIGSYIHQAFLLIIVKDWTNKGGSISTFELDTHEMWQSNWFKNNFCPLDCVNISFHEIIQKSLTKYYTFLNSNKLPNDQKSLNYLHGITLPIKCNFFGFYESIQSAFAKRTVTKLDDNILFVSFRSLPVDRSPVPLILRLRNNGKIFIYQIASIFYSSEKGDTMTTIISKSYNGEWFRFNWESKNNSQARNTVAIQSKDGIQTKDVLPRFHVNHDGIEYHLEGIIFIISWDQRSSFFNDYNDEIESPIVSRIDGASRSDVLANDLKSLKSSTGWLVESVISNTFVRLKFYFDCPNIFVEEVTQAFLDETILLDLGRIQPEERDVKLTCPYTDLETWKKVYDRIDEHLKISANLTELFQPNRFLFIPLNVHGNHWILMVVSTGQKRVFIMDSNLAEGKQSFDLYLGAILVKYLEYKASNSFGAFSMDSTWRVESLPVCYQHDGFSCGIHVIMNAAKIMRQIKANSKVQISFVENPVPKFTGKLKNLRENVVNIRSKMFEMFLYRETFENVIQAIFTPPLQNASQTPTKAKKNPNKKTPPIARGSQKAMKVVLIDDKLG